MLLGVVSDTHGHTANARLAARMLESLGVAAVLHCGDIGSPEIPPLFSPWPAHFVLGNVDDDAELLEAAVLASPGHMFHRRFCDLTLATRRIAMLHSDDHRRFRAAIESGDYDLVCYGHSHLAEQHREGKTLVLNPGALYRANPHTIAVVELDRMEATIVEVSR